MMRRFFDIDSFKEIVESLARNRSRSLLTGFGVFWGIFMLLFLMGGGDGIHRMLEKTFDGFATNSGFMIPNETSKPYRGFKSGRTVRMTQADVDAIRRNVPEIKTVSGIIAMWGNSAVYEDRSVNCTARGLMPDYQDIEALSLKFGRFINKVDVEQERRVCVIGKNIWKELFPDGENPCGEFIQVGGIYFQIVGVDIHDSAVSINGSAHDAVMIPMTTVQKIFSRGQTVDFIAMVAHPGVRIKDVIARSNEILSSRLYYDPEDTKAIISLNAQELFGIMDNLFRGLDLLIWLVGFGTLLAAAIGVSNIMMVTVRERTVEIGIRRAIGATPRMILAQIMAESTMLTTVAGILGIIVSVGILQVLEIAVSQSETPVPFQVSFGAAVLVLCIIVVLGLLAGLAPALRAMEIKPVEAMRDE